MYKVFVNKSLIILTENVGLENIDDSLKIYYSSPSQLTAIVNSMLDSESTVPVVIFHFDIDELWTRFISQFNYVHAAGGMVFNEKNQFLVIHRNQKWDLPKGHLEKGERPGFGGMREVEEECGIKELTIKEPLANTFHMYERNGLILKKTFWYLMNSTSNEVLIPQNEEGIDLVEWKTEVDLKELALKSHTLIGELLEMGINRVLGSNHE